MPTAYSTNLRLALPATGENAGTWGNIVNNNITSMIEQAVSGTASIVMTDADVTLTFNAGISDQARNAILSITSSVSLTATRNIIAPTGCAKAYTIYNGTTGGQSLAIKTSGGTASVTIANGATTQVFTPDGVNFFTAIGGLISGLTAGNATSAASATAVAGGVAGAVPYQSAPGATGFSAAGSTGSVLTSAGTSAPTWTAQSSLAVGSATTAGSVTNAVTFNNSGAGAASGTTYNGGSAQVISYNTIGAQVAGSYVTLNGALGTPASGTLTNCTFPTLNQSTTGTAAGLSSGSWTVTISGTKVYFAYGGANKFSIDSSGNLIVVGNVTAYGTP
jgi:hypothetical protein